MIIHDLSYLEERLKSLPAQSSILIYHGHIQRATKDDPLAMRLLPTMKGDNDTFKEGILTFGKKFPGNYTVIIKPVNEVVYLDNDQVEGFNLSNVPAFNGVQHATAPGQMDAIINARVNDLLKMKQLEDLLKEKDKEILQLNSTEHKFNNILERICDRFGLLGAPANLNGNTEHSMNSNEAADWAITDDLTDIEKAVCQLVQIFGEQGLIKVASKLYADPSLQQMVKNYLQ